MSCLALACDAEFALNFSFVLTLVCVPPVSSVPLSCLTRLVLLSTLSG
jgi:hypothetical protein